MKESHEGRVTFIGKLFDTLVLSKSKTPIHSISDLQTQQSTNLPFYQNFSLLLQASKLNIRKLCLNTENLEVNLYLSKESIARKIINILMFLSRDISFLLDEGILNLYMDLIEFKEKVVHQENIQMEESFVEKCIQFVEPLLYEFFVYREHKKMEKFDSQKLNKSLQLVKRFSGQSLKDTEIGYYPKLNKKQTLKEQDIFEIRCQIHSQKINVLLKQFLNEYEKELKNLEEVCKICSKKIKLNHLEEHVEYCQKKYIIKQDLKSLQKKMVSLANQLITKRKNIQNEGICHINSGPLTVTQELDSFGDQQYGELLYEIINVHRIGSLKNSTSKKIHSQAKIKENSEKYEDMIEKFTNYLEKSQGNEVITENLTIFLTMEKQILNQTLELRTVQIQYENLKEIVSSSSIKAPSKGSTNRISEKKSRFAFVSYAQNSEYNSSRKSCSQNKSRSSKVFFRTSKNIESNGSIPKQRVQIQLFKIDNFYSNENFDEDTMPNVTLKTKQSLVNNKNVHFHADQFEEDIKYHKKGDSNRKKSRRVKSMVMFDYSEDSDYEKEEKRIEKQSSSNISKPEESVGIKDFEILKFLGKGAFGRVYAVRKRYTKDLYALKMIDIDENWGSQEFEQIRNQHEIFKKVAGQHLVQAPYCFSEGGVHVFMMEFMPGGDLSKVLEEEVYLEEQRAKFVIAEIVLAIEHLHRAEIIHRDLKPQNLVIDERGHLKLTDFGLSEIKLQNKIQKVMNINKGQEEIPKRRRTRRTGIVPAKQRAQIIGTPDYIAPEIINGISINNKSIDWWSLGVISYEILIGARPFCGNTIQEVLDNILKFNIEWPEIGDQEGMISEKAHDFIQKLLSKDFLNRLGAQDVNEIKAHPFFEGVNWETLKHQPAHITPNYAKIKELLEMQEDKELRKQIQEKADKPKSNTKMPRLENFIRFDILGQKTVKEANKVIEKKTGTLKRLQSIKQIMLEKQNIPGKKSLSPSDRRTRVKSYMDSKEKEKPNKIKI